MNGNIGSIDTTPSSVIATAHPPVVQAMEALEDNGILAEGLVLAKDAAGKLVAYNPAGSGTLLVPVAVNVIEVDTAEQTTVNALRHGTVNFDKLLVGSAAPDADDIALLEAIGIFAV